MLSPLHLLLVLFGLGLALFLLQVGLLGLAFEKLGLSPASGFTLFLLSLFGSLVNIPIRRLPAEAPPAEDAVPVELRGLLRQVRREFTGETVLAVNFGGCVVPTLFSLHLMARHGLPLFDALGAVALVSAVAYGFSRPIPGLGIAMPMFVAPVAAALAALLINPEQAPALAYLSGTLGVLIGADLLHLHEIPRLGAPVASIGGAGTFDGIFMAGIVAVLLA